MVIGQTRSVQPPTPSSNVGRSGPRTARQRVARRPRASPDRAQSPPARHPLHQSRELEVFATVGRVNSNCIASMAPELTIDVR